MKKRILSLLLVIAMLVTVLPVNVFAADDCPSGYGHSLNAQYNDDGTHTIFCAYGYYFGCTYSETKPCELGEYTYYSSTQHYQYCSICRTYIYNSHRCDNWTVTSGWYGNQHSGTCKDCGRTISGSCSYSGQPYITENGQHWQVCSVCGTAGKKTNCSSLYGAEDNGNGTHGVTCDTCDVTSNAPCDYENDYNSTQHWQECTECGAVKGKDNHSLSYSASSSANYHDISCSGCDYESSGRCTYSTYNGYDEYDDTHHWDICGVCKLPAGKGTHNMSSAEDNGNGTHSGTCYSCGKTVTADCTYGDSYEYDYATGDRGHYKECTVCDGKTALSAHTNKTYSPYYEGVHTVKCADCGYSLGTGDCQYGGYTQTATQHSRTCTQCGDTVTGSHDYKNGVCICGAEKHDHNWVVSASGNTITVTCTGATGTCEYNKDGGKLTVTASNAVYDGSPKGASITNTIETGSYNDDRYSVAYYVKQANGNYTGIYSAPSDVGEYKVEVYSYLDSSKKASATFAITAKPVAVTATGYTGTYDGKSHGITVEVPEGLTVTYSEKEDGYYNDYSSPEYTDAGTYTVYYKVTGDKNHTVTNGTGSATVTINKADLKTAVKATDYDGVYDGKAHGITVEAPDNVTISYSKDGEDWSGIYYANSYTDVGEYTVYYKVAVSEYLKKNFTNSEVTGSATVKITQLDLKDVLNVTANDQTFTYNRYDHETSPYTPHAIELEVAEDYVPGTYDSITTEYSKDGGLTWSRTNPAFTDVGEYTVLYRVYVNNDTEFAADADKGVKNYIAIEGSKKVTITKADLPFDELIGYEGFYDGYAHYSFGYAVQENENWGYTYWPYYLLEDLTYDFSWTDDDNVDRTSTVTGRDYFINYYEGNIPGFTKQNVKSINSTETSKVVTVTISGKNYNTETFTYAVKIGPGLAIAENYEGEYDGKTHYIVNRTTVDAYGEATYEYKESTSDTWLPASQEPGRKDVGTTSVDWRVRFDSDGDGKVGGYDATGAVDANGICNKFGSKEVITGTNTVTITPALLAITANDNTITYGDEPAHNGVTITGFKGTDTAETVLDQTGATYTYSYKQFDDVGNYTITPADIKLVEGNENYIIVFYDGTLTVEQKELGIAWGETVLPYIGDPQMPEATATGTVNGDDIILMVDGAAAEVGDYTATVIGMDGAKAGNYKLPAELTTPYKIVKKSVDAPVVTAKDETIKGKNDGGIEGLTTEMEYSTDGGTTWTKVTDPDVALPAGQYLVRYAETDTSVASEAAEVTIKEGKYLTVTLPTGDGYTTSTEEKANEQTYNDTFTFEVEIKDGYSKGEDFKVTANGQELTPNTDGSYTVTGIVEDVQVKVEGVVDNTAPTGSITVATNQWKEFVNNITFGIFFKNTQTVTITAADAGSGVKSIEYLYCESVLTEEYVKAIVASEWAPYTAPFEIDPDAKVVVYAKITDKAGNVKYISSDGMVFDGTAPVFNGVQDGSEYNEDPKFTVSDDNLDKVTVDGKEVTPDENGVYTIPVDNKQHTVVATDKSGNKTEITVTLTAVYNVTLPKGDGYEAKGEPTVKNGDDYTFEVEIKDGYTKGDDFKVTVNGQEIKPNADGKYVVENVTSDLEIVVSGVEKIVESTPSKPTTDVPKTGDESFFLPLMLFMLSGIACVSLIVFKKKFRF